MRRTIAAVGLLGLGIMGTTLPAIATPDNGQGNNVSICHETGSETNPIVEIDVNENAVNGHGPGGNNGQGGGPGDNNGQGGGPGDNNGQGGGPGDNNGQGGHNDDACYQEPGGNEEPNVPPVVEPPAEEPPVDSPPVVAPPVAGPPVAAPPAAVPPAVVPKAPAAPVVKPAAKPLAMPPAAAPVAAAPAAAAPVAAVPAVAPAINAGYNVQTAAGGDAGNGIPSWLATLTGALAGLSGLVLLRGGARARKLEG
jgi:hypothetical protein